MKFLHLKAANRIFLEDGTEITGVTNISIGHESGDPKAIHNIRIMVANPEIVEIDEAPHGIVAVRGLEYTDPPSIDKPKASRFFGKTDTTSSE